MANKVWHHIAEGFMILSDIEKVWGTRRSRDTIEFAQWVKVNNDKIAEIRGKLNLPDSEEISIICSRMEEEADTYYRQARAEALDELAKEYNL